jgi:hypothetical protein
MKNKENTQTMFREAARLRAASSLSNVVDLSTYLIHDKNDGLNAGSVAILDTMSTTVVGANAAGVSTVTLTSLGTLVVGQEITYFDDVNLERLVVQSINVGTKAVTFAAPLTKAFKDKARLCRSSLTQDTVNGLLKFNGWSVITAVTNTAVNVVASAYDTSGNGGRKLVRLSNGWWVCVVVNGTVNIIFYKSTDNGTTWTQLCFITTSAATNAVALASSGNTVYMVVNGAAFGTAVSSYSFDATTVPNSHRANAGYPDPNETSYGPGISLAIAPNGTLTAAWVSKNITYPDSFNIRSAKSVDGGLTWTKQNGTAGVDQVSANNGVGTDNINPSIVCLANGYPVIDCQYANLTQYSILCYRWTGSAYSAAAVYSDLTHTYAQSNPCAAVAPNGRIWCTWYGLDATDTTQNNIRYSYSDDGGATWLTAVKLTNGNTYYQTQPTISIDKNNNVYVLWQAPDAASATYLNIFRNIWTGSAFTGVTKLTTNTTAGAAVPSSIDNNTLDFNLLTPPTIYRDSQAVAVKFSGTYITGSSTPVLVEDARYNIVPAAPIASAALFVDRETDANLTIAAAFSAHAATESYTSMAKASTTVNGSTTEDKFTMAPQATPGAKGTLRLTATRNTTALNKSIQQIYGAALV